MAHNRDKGRQKKTASVKEQESQPIVRIIGQPSEPPQLKTVFFSTLQPTYLYPDEYRQFVENVRMISKII